MKFPQVNVKKYAIDRKVLDLIPEKIARRYNILPLFKIENVLTIAISNPLNVISLDDISAVAGCKVEPVIDDDKNIRVAIDQWYGVGEARQELIENLVEEFEQIKNENIEEGKRESKYAAGLHEIKLKKEADEAPIIRLVNTYIVMAILEGASDIHLEPKKDSMIVRFRIDGFLYNRDRMPPRMIAPVTARIKIISGMDISKRRIPQDGRIGLVIRERNIDIRTSTYPSLHGENIVLRVLDKSQTSLSLSEIGFTDEDLLTVRKALKSTRGIILITGPTGSGKTTTVYSALNDLKTEHKKIITIEDPVEYEIEGLVQGQVDRKTGVDFASALRSILRQDPDIIYVGEIRDKETAQIAVRAALTGHLVLSTLHTNDAVGAITRLRDIGIESGLIGTTLLCSIAQRLVRKICLRCLEKYQPDEGLLKSLGLTPDTKLNKGSGCESCKDIGYKGRNGIFEILFVNDKIKTMISNEASEEKIIKAAKASGMRTMSDDGMQKVIKGVTTLDEIERVLDTTPQI